MTDRAAGTSGASGAAAAASGAAPTDTPAQQRRRRSWALLLRVLGRQRPLLANAVLGGLGWQAAGIVVPIVVGWTVQRGIVDGDRAVVWWGALVIVVLGSLEAACAAVRHRMATTAYMGATADLRFALTEAALGFDEPQREEFPPGEVIARATSDTDTVAGIADAVGHTIAEAVTIPVIVVVLAFIDPVLALVVGVLVPLTALLMFRATLVWERRSAAAQEAMGEAVAAAQESIEGFKVLRGLGAEAAAVDRFARRSSVLAARSMKVGRLWLFFEPALDTLAVVMVAAVLWIGGSRAIDGTIDIGEVITAIGLALFLAGPVRTIGERVLTVQIALASAARVAEVVDAVPARRTATDGPGRGAAAAARLEARGLTSARRDPGGAPLFAGLELSVAAGELVVLDGSVGAGKSTLLAVLGGLRPPEAGHVRLDGRDLADLDADEVRQRVLLSGPAPFLFGGTIADNLRFAAPDAAPEQLVDALRAAQLDGFVAGLPAGTDTVIGERGATLSGGQRQRVALARAVLSSPDVLLLDGATGALDPPTERACIDALRAALPTTAIVLVTTNEEVASRADAVVELRDGTLRVSA